MRNSHRLGLWSLLALVLTGCGKVAADTPPEDKRLRVTVVHPEKRDMVRRIELPGDVEGIERVAVYSRAAGYVREMRVDVGDLVEKDQVLAIIEAPDIDARQSQAKAMLRASEAEARLAETGLPRAKALLTEAEFGLERTTAERQLRDVTLDRKRNLQKDHGVTLQDVDEAEASAALARAAEKEAAARIETARAGVTAADALLASARERVETARAALAEVAAVVSFTELRAPFAGAVVERRADPGTYVSGTGASTASPIITVTRLDVLRAWIDVPEPDARFVTIGRPVAVASASANPASITSATVSRFAGALEPATRTLRVGIDIANPIVTSTNDRALKPGTYVHVRVDLESRAGALAIPAEALIVRKGKTYVFVVENGRCHRKKIVTGADDGERVEVLSGIEPDAAVVTDGKSAVSENAEVLAIEEAKKTTGTGR